MVIKILTTYKKIPTMPRYKRKKKEHTIHTTSSIHHEVISMALNSYTTRSVIMTPCKI